MSKYGDEILDIILNSTQHPTAEQIFMEMKKKNSKIVQATVYNNLKTLAESGKVIRISHPGFPDRYDNTSSMGWRRWSRARASPAARCAAAYRIPASAT